MTLTDQREIHGIIGLNKDEAESALAVLNMDPPQRRFGFALAAMYAIRQLNAMGVLKDESRLEAAGLGASGLVMEHVRRLPWKKLAFLCKAILEKDEDRLGFLKKDLERVAAGMFENNQLMQPFLAAETGAMPK